MALSVEDRLAIHDLVALHGHLMDAGEFDRLDELFTEDFVYLALVPEGGGRFVNQVAARVALRIVRERPGRHARRIQAPALFLLCRHDTVAPYKASLRHARTAPRGEVRTYDVGHFDIYDGPAFERNVADQLAFLARHVPVPG